MKYQKHSLAPFGIVLYKPENKILCKIMVKIKLVSLLYYSNLLMFTCNVNFSKNTSNKTEVARSM